jgi:F-box domain
VKDRLIPTLEKTIKRPTVLSPKPDSLLSHISAMSLYQWLARLFTRSRRIHFIKQSPKFLDLPLDIILLIFDQLPLHSNIIASQTCKTLQLLLHSKCSSGTRKLSDDERLKVLAGLADVLPDHQLCTSCNALHIVHMNDTPSNLFLRHECSLYAGLYDSHYFGICYTIRHYHVQLALKYARLGNVHQAYLRNLMESSSVASSGFYGMTAKFSVYPNIVDGRFILFTIWQFDEETVPLSLETLSRPAFRFCPHLGLISKPNPRILRNPLIDAVYTAFNVANMGQDLHHSCGRCPTDYSITVYPGRVMFHIWQDFGPGASPVDPCWRSHIWSNENDDFRGPTVFHQPGSIRDMYHRRTREFGQHRVRHLIDPKPII